MLKQIVKIFASFVLAMAGLCFIAVICLQIFLCTDPAGRIIEKRLNSKIPGQVNWNSQNISIFRGRLSMESVKILDPEGQKVVTAADICVNIGLADLLARRLLVESVSVIRPEVFLETGPGGKLNIIQAFYTCSKKDQTPEKKQSKAPAFNIRINEMSVKNAVFSFKRHASDSGSPTEVIVDDFDIVVSNADFAQKSGGLSFAADRGLVDTAVRSFPVDRILFEAMLLNNRIDSAVFRLKSGNSELIAEGTVDDIFSDPAPDIRVDLFADLSQVSSILKLGQQFSGNAKLTAYTKGSLKNPEVSLNLESEECSLAGMDFTGVSLAAGMKDRLVDVSSLKAGLNGGVIEFSGRADLTEAFAHGFASPPTDLEAISSSFELKTNDFVLPELTASGHLAGRVSGMISGRTSGISPKSLAADISARVSAGQLQPARQIVPFNATAQLSARLDNGIVSIEKLEADSEFLSISALGSYDIYGDNLDIDAQAGVADLEKLGQNLGISALKGGAALLEADVSGKVASPVADAKLWADRPGFADIAVESLEAQIGFFRGRLDLPFLKLAAGSSEINSSGHIQILEPQTFKFLSDPAIKLAVETDGMQISDIYPAIKGRVSAAANLRGSIAHPDGEIAADIFDLDTGVQTVSKARLRSVIRDRKIILEPLEIFLTSRKDQALRAGGWVSFDGQYEFKATSDPIDLSSVNRLRNSGIKGKAELSAHGSGKIDKPGFEAVIRLSGLEAEDISFSDTQIKARLTENNLFLNVDDPFEASAFYDLAGRNFSAKAEFSETNLTPFLGAGGLTDFSGTMACSIKAEGNTGDIINTRAVMNLGLLNLKLKGREIVSARDLSVFMENGGIKIPESRIDVFGDGYLNIQGAGGFDNSIDMFVKGSIPAAMASDFFEQIESSSGKIDLRAKLKGPVKKPVVSAEALFHDLEASFASTMQRLNSVNGKIVLSGEKLIFDGLRGRIDSGDFSVEGSVDLKNYSPQRADLKITTRALPIEIPYALELQLNSDLRFSGKPDHCELQGDIVVIEGSYFKDVDVGLMQAAEEIGKRRRQTEIRTEIKVPDIAFLKNLELNVGIGSRNPVMVDNNLALLSIRPQLSLKGTADNPLLNGRAEVTEGTVTYRNTEFEVKKGVVDFVNPYRIEPEVDIKAEAEIRKWTITLSVTGVPENLNFILSSNPHEEDADIVSLLAMGKTTRELANGSGGGASTEEMLANLVADQLSKKIKQGTGLDIVEVEYRNNGAEAEDAEEVRVTVGKELSRRLTVKYGVERKSGEMVQQSTGIYKLLENLSVNAFQDTEGEFGGEMRYRLEFR